MDIYKYKCRLVRVINGNTIEADIDLGFDIKITQRIKLYGIENNTEAGKTALIKSLPRDFFIETLFSKKGKTGRIMGTLYVETDNVVVNINELLVAEGIARKFG